MKFETHQGIIARVSRSIDVWFLDLVDHLSGRPRLRCGLALGTMAVAFTIFILGVAGTEGSNHLLSSLNPGRVEEHRYLQQHFGQRFLAEKPVFIGAKTSGENRRGERFDIEPDEVTESGRSIRKALQDISILIEIVDHDDRGILHGLAKWERSGTELSIEGDSTTRSAIKLRRTQEVKVRISRHREHRWRLAARKYDRAQSDPLVLVEPLGPEEKKRFCAKDDETACCDESRGIDRDGHPRCFLLRPFSPDEGESSHPRLVSSDVINFDEESGTEWIVPGQETAYMFVANMADLSMRPELQELVLAQMHGALDSLCDTDVDGNFCHDNDGKDADIYFAGIPILEAESATILSANRWKSFLILALFLSALFIIFIILHRNGRMLLVGICTIIGSVALSYGFFGLVFHRDAWLTGLLPVLVLALGTSAPIHILGSYHSQYGSSTEPIVVAKATIRRVFRPCFYAMLTTVTGLFLLGIADLWETLFPGESAGVDPHFMMRDFSISLLLGVMFSLILAVWFLVLFLPHPRRHLAISDQMTTFPRSTLLGIFNNFIIRWPLSIILVFASLSALGGYFAFYILDRGADARAFFDKNRHSTESIDFFERHFRGTNTYEIVVEGGGHAHYKEPIVDPAPLSWNSVFGYPYPQITMPNEEATWQPSREDCFTIDHGGEVPLELCLSDPQLRLLKCIIARYAYEDSDEGDDMSERAAEVIVKCSDDPPAGGIGISRSWTEDEDGGDKKLHGRTTSILDVLQDRPAMDSSHATFEAIENHGAGELRKRLRERSMHLAPDDPKSPPEDERQRRAEVFRRHVDNAPCRAKGPVHHGCATRLIRRTRAEDSVVWSRLSMEIGADIQAYSNAICEESDVRECDAVLTGIIPFFHENVLRFTRDMRWNLLLAIGVLIAVLYRFLFRKQWSLTGIAILPNVVAVSMLFLVMAAFDIAVDDVTVLVLVVSSGIIVDDTIHVLCRFERNLANKEMYPTELDAIRGAYVDTAIPVLMTSFVLIFGLFPFVFDELRPVANFGILLMSTIISALLADFVLLPALLVSRYLRRSPRRRP